MAMAELELFLISMEKRRGSGGRQRSGRALRGGCRWTATPDMADGETQSVERTHEARRWQGEERPTLGHCRHFKREVC